MSKKKKSVELSNEEIKFTFENRHYKIIRYYPTQMNVDVMEIDANGVNIGLSKLPFAHIPREIKKRIKPN
jgi:hypothetical protein